MGENIETVTYGLVYLSTSTAALKSTPAQRTHLSWSTCHQANLSYKSTDFGEFVYFIINKKCFSLLLKCLL
ncbi:hypothetical protein AAFF_G00266760 [Aldrovandia affinis]|uniref:Uncharacterized protein n=1 Tax=Aldrovandia affinis TaxID=143900 RepID=A0AAD7W2J2_9TELE|nr:hypothetical protein AAFF_G00266760 [Aldrovandia affinis]